MGKFPDSTVAVMGTVERAENVDPLMASVTLSGEGAVTEQFAFPVPDRVPADAIAATAYVPVDVLDGGP